MADAFWRIRFRGTPQSLTINDLSLQRLREMKARFGESYGIPTEYIGLLLRGDFDAIACALWINQQKAGGEVEDPATMDFSLADFEKMEDPPEPKSKAKGKKADPTKPDTTTGDSDETQSPTETPTSSTSETSAG